MNRSSRRRKVFRTESDHQLFLELLGELPGRFGTRVHGYALMGNHFHAMLECPSAPLPAVMAWFGGALARRMNLVHRWDGPLFRGRYRNRIVLDDAYWRDLLSYLHLNPVRAGLVDHPDRSTWTSHRAYAGFDAPPPWLQHEELLGLFGSPQLYRERIEELLASPDQLPQAFEPDQLWRTPSTDAAALVRVPAAVMTLTSDDALTKVSILTGATIDSLRTTRVGRTGNLPRALAAWWLGRAAGLSRRQVGQVLGMTPAAVGAAAHRVRTAEGTMAEWRDALMQDWWGT